MGRRTILCLRNTNTSIRRNGWQVTFCKARMGDVVRSIRRRSRHPDTIRVAFYSECRLEYEGEGLEK